MNLELTDEQVALRDTVRSFLADRASIAEHVRPMLNDATGTTEAVWQGLADLGTTGLLVPSEYDGAGMTMVEAGIVLDRRTRMLYDDEHVFINGESFRAGGQDALLMRQLADQRVLSAAQWVRASDEAKQLLEEWSHAGWMHSQGDAEEGA